MYVCMYARKTIGVICRYQGRSASVQSKQGSDWVGVCLEHCHAANNFLSDQQENAQIMLPQCPNNIITVCAGEARAQCYSKFTNLLSKLDYLPNIT